MKPTIARMFRATQRVIIETLSQRCGRKMRMSRIPTPNFGSAILRKAQASVKMTQKAAVGTVSGKLAGVICLVESSAFWKTAALIMPSTYWTKQSAPRLVVRSAVVQPWRRTYPGHGEDEVVPADGLLVHAQARNDSHTKENRRYSGERPCRSRGLVCASNQSFLVSHGRYM
jgi:hypothetical protein